MAENKPALNIPKESIKIDLDKRRHMRLDLNAMIDIQEYLGADDIMSMFFNRKYSFRDVREILFILLRHEDADLTPERVGEIVTIQQVKQFDTILKTVVEGAFGPFEQFVDSLASKMATKFLDFASAFSGTGTDSTEPLATPEFSLNSGE